MPSSWGPVIRAGLDFSLQIGIYSTISSEVLEARESKEHGSIARNLQILLAEYFGPYKLTYGHDLLK